MRIVTLLLLSLGLVGCAAFDTVGESFSGIASYFSGGEDNAEPPAVLVEYQPEIKITTLWDENIGVGSALQSLKLVPAIGPGKIVAADNEGLVQAREIKTGHLLWEVDTELHFSSGPGLSAGTVVLGTSDAEVVALNSENGTQLWKVNVSSEVLSVPVIVHDTVIVRTVDGATVALNEKTGAKLWSYEVNPPPLSIRGTSTPVVVQDNVIAGFDNGKLMALRLSDGKFVWEASVAIPSGRSEVERLVDLDVDLIESAGVIYVAGYHGGVSAVSVLDGDVLWRNDTISSYAGLGNDWRNVYLSDSESDILQLDQRTGSALWKQKELHQRKVSAPAIYENYVVVGDFEGYVHWLSTTDGRQLARVQAADSAIVAKPVIIDNVVYIYAEDGTLAALTAN